MVKRVDFEELEQIVRKKFSWNFSCNKINIPPWQPHHLLWVTPTNSSQSDTLQIKSPILVKQSGGATSPFIFYEPGTGAGCNM